MKLIPLDALLVAINKRITDAPISYIGHHRVWAYNDVKDIIDTLEVKEVDFDKPLGEVKIHTSMESGSLDEVILTTKYIAKKGK